MHGKFTSISWDEGGGKVEGRKKIIKKEPT